ncbi:MAG: SAM-dependent methyltransferase [Verrucomicrobiales bacterium]|jgi:SAM-dependent methyltransferase
MDHSAQKKIIDRDMSRLEAMLARVAKSDEKLQRKIAEGDDLQLLDLACGACDEAETLTKFFSKLRRGKNLKLTGLDIRAREIADAAARFKQREDAETGSKIDFEFLQGDATKLDGHQQLPGEFDVVFMRHQNLWNGKKTWEEIYQKALDKLSPDGRLIITSYFDREHELALDVIKEQGGELIVTAANEDSRELQTAGKSVDRHVAILKRRD